VVVTKLFYRRQILNWLFFSTSCHFTVGESGSFLQKELSFQPFLGGGGQLLPHL